MNNEFINTGVFIAHEGRNYVEPRAICVCGVARSGTTSIASGLDAAGIPMGGNLSNVKEDQDFRRSIQSDNPKKLFDEYLRRRLDDPNRANDLPIGFKFPDAYKSIEHISNTQGLCILATMRDPLAIAIRNTESVFQPFDVSLDQALTGLRNLVQKVQSEAKKVCNARIIFVSYEKVLSSPGKTFKSIYESSGMPPNNALHLARKSTRAVTKDSRGYRMESNLQPDFKIDSGTPASLITGWCCFRTNPEKKVVLQIRSDNRVLGTTTCDLPREDLGGERCGFKFDLITPIKKDLDGDDLKIFIGESSFALT